MRTMPAALQAHLDQPVTTTCRLLRFELQDGSVHGLTTLDQDVTYQGVTYSAMNGFDSNVIASDAAYSVDNSEAYALLWADIPGITVEGAKRGDLDDAKWTLLLVNYRDLSMGHVLLDAGDVGEVKVVDDTVYLPELLSYVARLRNSIGGVDSRTCRAVFGTPADSQTGCGIDGDQGLWHFTSVTALDAEDDRRFSADNLASDLDLVPGRLRWHTGANATTSLRRYQVEAYQDGVLSLFEPLPFPVQVGDQFSVRADCDKTFAMCRDRWNNRLNFKGEPLIPTNDGTSAQTPGASV